MSKHNKQYGESQSDVQTGQRQQQDAVGRNAAPPSKTPGQQRAQPAQRDQQGQQAPGRDAAGNQRAQGKQQAQQSQRSSDSAQDKSKRGTDSPIRGNSTNVSEGNDEDSTLEGAGEMTNEDQPADGKAQPRHDEQKQDKNDEGCGCTGRPDQPR